MRSSPPRSRPPRRLPRVPSPPAFAFLAATLLSSVPLYAQTVRGRVLEVWNGDGKLQFAREGAIPVAERESAAPRAAEPIAATPAPAPASEAVSTAAAEPVPTPAPAAAPEPAPTPEPARTKTHRYALEREQIEAATSHARTVDDLLRLIDVPGHSVGEVRSQLGDQAGPGSVICLRDNRSSPRHRLSRQQVSVYEGCARVYVDDVPLGVEEGVQVLESMSPEDVCRMQVVPALEAGARFGPRGANGVILVYTRPCRQGPNGARR